MCGHTSFGTVGHCPCLHGSVSEESVSAVLCSEDYVSYNVYTSLMKVFIWIDTFMPACVTLQTCSNVNRATAVKKAAVQVQTDAGHHLLMARPFPGQFDYCGYCSRCASLPVLPPLSPLIPPDLLLLNHCCCCCSNDRHHCHCQCHCHCHHHGRLPAPPCLHQIVIVSITIISIIIMASRSRNDEVVF